MSVVLPLITICLLQVRAIQESYVAFLVVADFECEFFFLIGIPTN